MNMNRREVCGKAELTWLDWLFTNFLGFITVICNVTYISLYGVLRVHSAM